MKFVDFNLSLPDCKAIGKILTDSKTIKELEITRS
jgi:hypothetical protein